MKIGVEMRLGEDPRETFADARAIEAAGADSLWVIGHEGEDPLTFAAALAAVTWRIGIVVPASPGFPEARRTVESITRGRLVAAELRSDDIRIAVEGGVDRWQACALPPSRAEWKALRAEREAQGFAGLVVPNGPRLLDLLRNPDTEEDRSDIKLAFG
jgi:hypothetical protein